MPAAALPLLRKVDIWIEDGSQARGMCFHPSADWLRAHGKDPAKAGCVEISDPRDFLDWVGHQQWMVLHEMAHAWHFRVLETRHPKESETLRKAYQHARQSGIYQRVLYWDGHRERSYAMQDEHEYFAELSEAWFGCNDIYPFVRAELLELDPVGAAAVKAAWEVKEP